MKVFIVMKFDQTFPVPIGIVANASQGSAFIGKKLGRDVEFREFTPDYHSSEDNAFALIAHDVFDPKPKVAVKKLPEDYRRGCHVVDVEGKRCDFFPIDSVQERIAHLNEAHAT